MCDTDYASKMGENGRTHPISTMRANVHTVNERKESGRKGRTCARASSAFFCATACTRCVLLFRDNWKSHCKICECVYECMVIMKFRLIRPRTHTRFKMHNLLALLRGPTMGTVYQFSATFCRQKRQRQTYKLHRIAYRARIHYDMKMYTIMMS